jgi:hypothetical protein
MRVLIIGFLAASMLALGAPVQSASSASKDPRMTKALDRVEKGRWTQADLAYIKRDRSLADKVADPRPSASDSGASSGRTPTSTRAGRALGTCGHWYKAWYRKRSLLGSTIYKYHHKAVWCQTAGKITRWQSRTDYPTEADFVVYWRKLILNQRYGIGSAKAYSRRTRHIELCVAKYGCYQSFYPWVGLTIRANGKETYKGSGG